MVSEDDVQIGVLGPLMLTIAGHPISDIPGQERAILSLLAMRADRPVPVGEVARALWNDQLPKSSRKSVQVLVYRTRRRIERAVHAEMPALIDTEGESYRLRVSADRVDVLRFESLIATARATVDQHATLDALDEALGLWRGDPVPDLDDIDVGDAVRARLGEMRLGAQEDRFEVLLGLGRHAEVIAEVESALAAHPLRERRWAQLMTALYRSGRQADALRAYQRIRSTLIEELGIEPGPDLRRLEASIIAHDPALDVDHQQRGAGGGHLPDLATQPADANRVEWAEQHRDVAFVDRIGEMERTRRVWEKVRREQVGGMVILSGESGVGKTRLAAEVAIDASADGAVVRAGRCAADVAYSALREAFPEVPTPSLGRRSSDHSESMTSVEYAAALVDRLAQDSGIGTLLVIDDLHHADLPSLSVLRRILDRLRGVPALMLATFNDDEIHPPGLVDLLADLHRVRYHERITLGGLAPDDAVSLIEARIGVPVMPDTRMALAAIAHETGGRPLALLEMADHLVTSGAIADGEWVCPEAVGIAAVGLPETLVSCVLRRFDRLPEDVRRLLSAVAVVGVRFDLHEAALAGGVAADEALDLLDAALAAHLIVEVPGFPEGYAFTTAIERQVLLDQLSRGRRTRIAMRLAEHRAPVTLGTAAMAEAASLLRAGDVSEAWGILRRVADDARDVGDPHLLAEAALGASRVLTHLSVGYPPAIDLLRNARDQLEPGDPILREVETALIRELMWAGRWSEAIAVSAPAGLAPTEVA